MSGTINLSLSQRFDNETHEPLAGGLLYFIQAGTTSTPQSAYQDSDLTIAYPNPIVLDEGGNVPAFFLADGVIKIRLTNSDGIQQLVADNLQVIGASSGSGGGGTVDATTILATGDIKCRYGTGALSGFVRLNGRTIGSSTSGASERANADCQALFEYLWGIDSTSVVGGAGASASADWSANKALTLPDFRGRVMAAMDDMGNTAAGRLTSAGAVTGTTLGYGGGEQLHTMTTAEMVQHSHTVTTNNSSSTFDLTINGSQTTVDKTNNFTTTGGTGSFTTQGNQFFDATPNVTIPANSLILSSAVSDTGSSTPFNIVQPTITVTVYCKL